MKVIQVLEKYEKTDSDKIIFLAGPTYRVKDGEKNYPYSWRIYAIEKLKNSGFDGIVVSPEWRGNIKPNNWTYIRQISWEIDNLQKADTIIFWIPRDLDTLPAFTTNIEFGEYLNSNKIMIGSPKDAPKNDYLKERCALKNIKWYDTLDSLVIDTVKQLKEKSNGKIFFTSDTHFSEQRTLELFKRPFKDVNDMDWTVVKNWNSVVSNNDVVYHLGDFGNTEFIKYLNFKEFIFLPGNYDSDSIKHNIISSVETPDNKIKKSYGNEIVTGYNDLNVKNNIQKKDYKRLVTLIENNTQIVLNDTTMNLVHEPEKNSKEIFYLFGHIHKLGMVKKNGLNVGTDCHNFTPLSSDDIMFYYNAITKYYDNNVFLK